MPPPQEDPKIGFLEGALAMALGQLEKQESVPTAEPTLVPSGFEIRPEVGMTDPSRVFPDDTRRVRRVPTDLYAPPPERPLIRPANYLGQPLPKSMGEVLDRLKTGGMAHVDFIRLFELLSGLPTELAGIGSESRYGGPPLKRPGQGFMKSVIERAERRPLINRILGDPASALPPVSSVNVLSGLSAVRRTELIREVIGLGERTPQLMPELIRTIKSSLGRQLTNDEVNVIREKIGRELTDDEMRVVRETVVESPAGAAPQRPAGALPGVVERAPGYRADPVTDPSGVLGRGRGISPGARVSRPTQPRRAPGEHEALNQRLAELNRRIDELYTKDEFLDTDAAELDVLNKELYAVEAQIAALPRQQMDLGEEFATGRTREMPLGDVATGGPQPQLIDEAQVAERELQAKARRAGQTGMDLGPVVDDVADFKATILDAHRSVEGGRVEGLAENLLSTYGDAEIYELARWADTSDNAYIRNAIGPVIRRAREGRAPQVAKEPWQMTREEFAAAIEGGKLYRADPIGYTGAPRAGATDLAQGESAKYPANDIAASYVARVEPGALSEIIETGPVFRTLDRPTAEGIDLGRKAYIEDAIAEGKDVPDSVLREYPDLAPVVDDVAELPVSLLTNEQLMARYQTAEEGSQELWEILNAARNRNLDIATGEVTRPVRPVTPQVEPVGERIPTQAVEEAVPDEEVLRIGGRVIDLDAPITRDAEIRDAENLVNRLQGQVDELRFMIDEKGVAAPTIYRPTSGRLSVGRGARLTDDQLVQFSMWYFWFYCYTFLFSYGYSFIN